MRYIKIIFFLTFFCFNLLAKDYYFIGYFPDIPPVKKFSIDLTNYLNSLNNKKIYLNVKKGIFQNSKELLDAVQSNIIQIAIIPAYVINNELNNSLKSINFIKPDTLNDSYLIPFRQALQNYGLFLLDAYFSGNYSIFSRYKLNKKKNFKKIVLGELFNVSKFKKLFFKTLIIDETSDVKGLIKSDIINSVLLTPLQFSYFNLLNTNLQFKNQINGIYDYQIIVANSVFWSNLNFSDKSVVWSYITNYYKIFQSNFSRYNIYIENQISQKLFLFKLGNIIH